MRLGVRVLLLIVAGLLTASTVVAQSGVTTALPDHSRELATQLAPAALTLDPALGTAGGLQATLEADPALVPPQNLPDVTGYLGAEFALLPTAMVVLMLAAVAMLVVWRMRQNAVIRMGDPRKKKKRKRGHDPD